MIRFAATLLVLALAPSCRHSPAASEVSNASSSPQLARLAQEYWDYEMRKNPVWATFLADRRFDGELPDLTPAGVAAARQKARTIHGEATSIDPAGLSAQDRITRLMLLALLEGSLDTEICELHLWDVNALDGVQNILGEMPQLHSVREKRHAEALLARYRNSGDLLDQHVSNLRAGQRRGYLAAKPAVVRVVEQLETMLTDPPERSIFVTTVRLPDVWPEGERSQWRARLLEAARASLYPGLRRYRDFLRGEYLASAREKVGVRENPDGERCYRARIRSHTHLDLSPEEIHRLGLKEAERNLAGMKEIARRLTGGEDLEVLKARFAAEPSQRVNTREELIQFAERLIARAEAKLPNVLGRRPRQHVQVKPIEEFREQSSPTGYYYNGSEAEDRPGFFYLNAWDPASRVLYLLEALTFHEAIPGHHIQGALAQELKGLPRFRRELGDPAFTEGWAHYAELLADELGLYSGDAGRFGMLSDQALRAVRLVVDTGMHQFGWTRERALAYMRSHTAEPAEDAAREIDRYIAWPGQALAYKLGQLEILKLRAEATARLGAQFDVRAFHDALLSNGAIPLPVLRAAMGEWLSGQIAGGAKRAR
jgi:uncharacterized protein (DUF885 family)